MTGVPHIEIKESAEELKQLMKKQTSSLSFAKLQSLYLLKIKAVETVRYLAILMGRGESTIHRWLKVYREKGIKGLLNEEEEEYEEENLKPPGRPEVIDVETAASIYQELKEEEGFSSYQEVRVWLDLVKGVKFSYITVWRFCHNELKAKLKVPRPKSTKQEKGVIKRFKQELSEQLTNIGFRIKQEIGNQTKIRYWCGDETRLGLQTIEGKILTLKGVKPQGNKQWKFDYYYLYGLVEPKTGEAFYYEFSNLDLVCFEIFLELFSQAYPDEIQILQLDNAPSHTSENLAIPENIVLLFQPPYTPEVNPIERLWEHLKNLLTWLNFEELDKLRDEVRKILSTFSKELIQSLTGWDFILNALSLSGI